MFNIFSKKVIRSILLIVVLPLVALRLLGIWQWIEWYSYDLLFYLSPPEPPDERVVLVTWDEQDLQASQEATMSDLTLGFVLEKIKAQQPRVIGLDLYRDLPVSSRQLSKQENEEAYQKLIEIFRSTPNLVGIEKIRGNIINPNPILQEQNRTFSSDLITDPDNVIRRSFINTSSDYSYIGTALGYLYLIPSGWKHFMVGNSSLAFSKDSQKIVLQDLKTFDGGYINNRVGFDFLINWRRGTSSFPQYSVSALKTGAVPTDAFTDKIVLIGNVSSSSPDLHHLPVAKWDERQPWTHGVEIVAHVASSIISAALDDRPLLRVAPWGMGYLFMALAITSVALVASWLSTQRLRKLYLISSLFSLILTIVLVVVSLIAFPTLSWWIPIVPAVLGIWLTFFVMNYEVQINREKTTLSKLRLLVGHLGHEIGNSTYAIQMNAEEIDLQIEDATSLLDSISALLQSHEPSDDSFPLEELRRYLDELDTTLYAIQKQTPEIGQMVQKISRHRERTKYYIRLTSLWEKREQEMTMVNDFVRQLVEKALEELQDEYKTPIEVKQIYDPNLSRVRLDRFSLEIILNNLLENAWATLSAKANQASDYQPTLLVKTQKSDRRLKIIVEDNGEGISPTLKPRIFESGISGKPAGQGQGIGLFLVKEFLTLEEGNIELESTPGEGSKFIVSLPRKSR